MHPFTYHVLMLQLYVQVHIVPVHTSCRNDLSCTQSLAHFRLIQLHTPVMDTTEMLLHQSKQKLQLTVALVNVVPVKILRSIYTILNTNLPGRQSGPVLHQLLSMH